LRDTRAQSLLDEVLAGVDHRRTPRKFDLLIVDEVHSIAPVGRGRYGTGPPPVASTPEECAHFLGIGLNAFAGNIV
jgi:hypothetical protein